MPCEGSNNEVLSTYIGAGHGRGGCRNAADRTSHALTVHQVSGLIDAANYAARSGMPFNRFTTIHWQAAKVASPLVATGGYLKRLGSAARNKKARFAYLWVRENGPGKGEHVHILWHGPAIFPEWRNQQRAWLKAEGAVWKKGVCDTRAIGRSVSAALQRCPAYDDNLTEVLGYVLKGCDEEAHRAFDLWRDEPGGLIVGKRCGASQNIGAWARLKASA